MCGKPHIVYTHMYTHTLTQTDKKSVQFSKGLSYSVKVTLSHPIKAIMCSCSPLPVSSPQNNTDNVAQGSSGYRCKPPPHRDNYSHLCRGLWLPVSLTFTPPPIAAPPWPVPVTSQVLSHSNLCGRGCIIFFFCLWPGHVTYTACLCSPLGMGWGGGGLVPSSGPTYVLSGTAQRPEGWHIITSKPLVLERKRPVVIHTQGPASLNGLAARLCPQLN